MRCQATKTFASVVWVRSCAVCQSPHSRKAVRRTLGPTAPANSMNSSEESTNGLSCLHPYPVDALAAAPGCSSVHRSFLAIVLPSSSAVPPRRCWSANQARLGLPLITSRYIVLLLALDELAGHGRTRWRQDQTSASAMPNAMRPLRGCARATHRG